MSPGTLAVNKKEGVAESSLKKSQCCSPPMLVFFAGDIMNGPFLREWTDVKDKQLMR